MTVHADILGTIGSTPLVRLARAAPDVELYAKLEAFNPGGSSKDRLALRLVEDAEQRGSLRPGAAIVEATAGNTGVGLAMVSAVKGYRLTVVVPHDTSPVKQAAVRAYGASVRVCTEAEDYVTVALALARETGAFHPDQFMNPANPGAHITTAQEIWRDLGGRIDVLVAVCGTGGTLAGVGHALRERAPALELVRVIPGDAQGETDIEGVAPDGPPAVFACPALTHELRLADAEAFAAAALLAQREGILVGGSGGAAFAGALAYARGKPPGTRVVAILPDTGRNYLIG